MIKKKKRSAIRNIIKKLKTKCIIAEMWINNKGK